MKIETSNKKFAGQSMRLGNEEITFDKEGKFEVYYVEQKGKIFKKEVLKPFITWRGTDEVYAFSSIDIAIRELKQEVIKQTERI